MEDDNRIDGKGSAKAQFTRPALGSLFLAPDTVPAAVVKR